MHQHDADAGEDDGEGERHVDLEEALPRRHAHAARGVPRLARHAFKTSQGVGDHRQQRIGKQRDEGRRNSDAGNTHGGSPRYMGADPGERCDQ